MGILYAKYARMKTLHSICKFKMRYSYGQAPFCHRS